MTEQTDVQPFVLILETKLRRPTASLPLITRSRLLDQLTSYLDRRFILISAPAGYGKTTIVSQWLESAEGAYAWVSLDEQDNDLSTFLLYIVAAIRTVDPEAMGALDQLLRAQTFPTPNQLADVLLQDMIAVSDPFNLVLDDYHVIEKLEIHALIARLVAHLPQHVRLLLITQPIRRYLWNGCAGANSFMKSALQTCVSVPRRRGCYYNRCWGRESAKIQLPCWRTARRAGW